MGLLIVDRWGGEIEDSLALAFVLLAVPALYVGAGEDLPGPRRYPASSPQDTVPHPIPPASMGVVYGLLFLGMAAGLGSGLLVEEVVWAGLVAAGAFAVLDFVVLAHPPQAA